MQLAICEIIQKWNESLSQSSDGQRCVTSVWNCSKQSDWLWLHFRMQTSQEANIQSNGRFGLLLSSSSYLMHTSGLTGIKGRPTQRQLLELGALLQVSRMALRRSPKFSLQCSSTLCLIKENNIHSGLLFRSKEDVQMSLFAGLIRNNGHYWWCFHFECIYY